MAKKDLTSAKTLDDYMKDYSPASIDNAFDHFDKHMDSEVQNNLFNNILAPAQDAFYKALTDELGKSFDDDSASTYNQDSKLKSAAVKGLKAFFKKASPNVLSGLKDMDESDIESQYTYLSHHYDQVELEHSQDDMQQGLYSLNQMITNAMKSKKHKVSDLKRNLYVQKHMHATKLQLNYSMRRANEQLSKVHPVQLANYLKPKLEEKGIKIKDLAGFYTQGLDKLIQVRQGLSTGDWNKKQLSDFHIEYTKKEEHKK